MRRITSIFSEDLQIAPGNLECSPESNQAKDGNHGFQRPDFFDCVSAQKSRKSGGRIQQSFVENGKPAPFDLTAGDGIKNQDTRKDMGENDGQSLDDGSQSHAKRGITRQAAQGIHRQ